MLTKEQKEIRKTGIGGSDVAGIVGLSKWKTPLQVYLSKTSDFGTEEETKAMARGSALEPFVRGLFAKQTGFSVELCPHVFRHPGKPFMLGNLDGIIASEQAVLEIKTCNSVRKNEFGAELTDEIPTDYLLQVQHYLMVTGLEKGFVSVLFGDEGSFQVLQTCVETLGVPKSLESLREGLSLKTFFVKKNANLQNQLLNLETDFWVNHVEKRIAPQWKTREDILLMFPNSFGGKKVIASSDEEKLIETIKLKKQRLKELEESIAQDENKLLDKLQDAELLVSEEGKKLATWKSQIRKLFDKAACALRYPDIVQEYTKETSNRVLRIS